MIQRKNSEAKSARSQVLLAKDLRKSYGERFALRGLSFSLKAGRILGFLGPNGAGKTTAIRILTTILEPDSGNFVVAGISSKYPERIREKIGVLPESLGFPKNITAIEYLTYFGQLFSQNATEAKKRGLALLTEVGLEQRAKSLIGSFSRGMRQRLGIARALINDPAVVFLDEPTLGLDPRGQMDLLAIVTRIARERNAGVILCSHDLPEVESVCDDVLILKLGRVIATGTVAEVIGRSPSRIGKLKQGNGIRIQVPTKSVIQAKKVLLRVPSVLKVTPSGENSGWLAIEFANLTNRKSKEYSYLNNKVLYALIRAEIPIMSLETGGGRLQDVFLQLTESPN